VNGELSAFEGGSSDAEEGADTTADAGDAMSDADATRVADGYHVDVKRSARKASVEAGTWVRDNGTERTFDSKPQASSWARELTRTGDRTVWVQDAHPKDHTVDGYLVARRYDPERKRGREQTAATDQTSLEEL
jgi:hypothetical protein